MHKVVAKLYISAFLKLVLLIPIASDCLLNKLLSLGKALEKLYEVTLLCRRNE